MVSVPSRGAERETGERGETGVTVLRSREEMGGGRGEDAEGLGGRGECNRTE